MNDLLEYIDLISESCVDAEMDVILSLSDVYTKQCMVLEHCGESYFQEEENNNNGIINQAKGNSNESMIKRILLFIPRLIKAIFQKVFGKQKQQIDSMADKIINSNVKLKDDIVIELTIDLNEKLNTFLGLTDTGGTLEKMFSALDNKSEFDSNDIKAVDELISKYNGVLDKIKNEPKKKYRIHANDNPAGIVTIIRQRYDHALKALQNELNYFDKNEIMQKISKTTNETSLEFLNKVQQLIKIMGNVAATFENLYNNEIKPIYVNIFGQNTQQNQQNQQNTNDQKNNDNQYQGNNFNKNRLKQWIRNYKQQNPKKLQIVRENNNVLFTLYDANNNVVADYTVSVDKVDKSLIPEGNGKRVHNLDIN